MSNARALAPVQENFIMNEAITEEKVVCRYSDSSGIGIFDVKLGLFDSISFQRGCVLCVVASIDETVFAVFYQYRKDVDLCIEIFDSKTLRLLNLLQLKADYRYLFQLSHSQFYGDELFLPCYDTYARTEIKIFKIKYLKGNARLEASLNLPHPKESRFQGLHVLRPGLFAGLFDDSCISLIDLANNKICSAKLSESLLGLLFNSNFMKQVCFDPTGAEACFYIISCYQKYFIHAKRNGNQWNHVNTVKFDNYIGIKSMTWANNGLVYVTLKTEWLLKYCIKVLDPTNNFTEIEQLCDLGPECTRVTPNGRVFIQQNFDIQYFDPVFQQAKLSEVTSEVLTMIPKSIVNIISKMAYDPRMFSQNRRKEVEHKLETPVKENTSEAESALAEFAFVCFAGYGF